MKTLKALLLKWRSAGIAVLAALLVYDNAQASDTRARADYMIHCQGCHLPDGSGFPGRGVPDMRATLPLLLSVEGGREFLIQVPGSSQSALSDPRLAGVLNWLITTKTTDNSLDFIPYSSQEISAVRHVRLDDVFATREALIGHLEGHNGRTPE